MPPIIYYNPAHKHHRMDEMHPECPQRVEAIMSHLAPYIDDGRIELHTFQSESPLQIEYPIRSWTLSDGDTYETQHTKDVLTISRTMIHTAIDDLLEGKTSCAFVLTRPPGHHASADGPNGFCHENNVWTAVQKLQSHGQTRIGIYDWDVHHGDGTQAHVEAASPHDILFVSTHAYGPGIYPGTGKYLKSIDILNLPFPPGTDDAFFLSIFHNEVIHYLTREGPRDMIVVSAGYDAHKDDPMKLMSLSTSVYETMAATLKKEFDCPILFLLEGGYNPSVLGECVVATLKPFI